MNRRATVLVTFLVALFLMPTVVTAQARLFIGAGATSPAGDYGEVAKTGWLANVGVGFPLKNPKMSVSAAGWYGNNGHDDADGGSTDLYGLMAHLKYSLHDPARAGLFLAGGGGFLVHKYNPPDDLGGDYSDSETNFEYSLAAGVDLPLKGKLGLYGLLGYVGGEDTFLRIMAGVTIPLGGSK